MKQWSTKTKRIFVGGVAAFLFIAAVGCNLENPRPHKGSVAPKDVSALVVQP